MTLKNKLTDAKTKAKKFAPQIALFSASVAGIAYAVYSTAKSATPVTIINQGAYEPGEYDEVVVLVTGEELKKLSENDSYEVIHVDRDLFQLKETKN